MNEVSSQIVDFVWNEEPDLALEAGYLPSRLWEDLSGNRSQRAFEKSQILKEAIDRSSLSPSERMAADFHVTSTLTKTGSPPVSMLNHMWGPVGRLAWASLSWPLGSDPSCERYIERLEQFPAYCQSLLRCIGNESTTGRYASRAVLSAFVAQADAFIESERGESGQLSRPLENARAAGRDVGIPRPGLIDDVLTSVLSLRRLAESLINGAQPYSPYPSMEDGLSQYSSHIYVGTSLHIRPDSVEGLGREMLARSATRFNELLASGQVAMTSPRTGQDLLGLFQEAYDKLTAALPSITSAQPIMGCEVVPMPEAHAVTGPPAYYGPSSYRNARQGSLFVNTNEPIVTRYWGILPLAMHEGVPGHHLQLAILDENENLSDLVRVLFVNSFTEGWAVYAETLVSSMNLDISPADEFGLLASQRWRAARLVVDVALHSHGWSVADAARFMSEQTAQDLDVVRREVVRYLAWPGQALGYAIGSHVIAKWVGERRKEGLQLPDAHENLFSMGSVPLSALTGSGDLSSFGF